MFFIDDISKEKCWFKDNYPPFTYIHVYDIKDYDLNGVSKPVFWNAGEFLHEETLAHFDKYSAYWVTGDCNYQQHNTNNLELIYFPIHDYAATQIWSRQSLDIDCKEHTHLCLNAKDVGHRRFIASLLDKRGITTYLQINNVQEFFHPSLGFTVDQYHQALTFDTPCRPFDTTNHIRHLPRDIFQKTCYSVIGETTFQTWRNQIVKGFLTEKTYSAIANCHPFILAAPYGRLEQLHDEGYHTFSAWWSEDYDAEKNDGRRLGMIGEVITEIQKYSLDDWKIILSEMRDVLENNQDKLYSIDIDDRITKKLTNKML